MFITCSLNINGLNSKRKQGQLIQFMRYHSVDVLFLQEHNLREAKDIGNDLKDFCYISLNNAICSKGGTAILINKKLPFRILSEEKSADSLKYQEFNIIFR